MKGLFVVALAFGMISCGGNNNQQPATNDLAQLENDWMHAMMKRDQPMLNQLVAPEFTVSGMKYIDSAAVTRGVWMSNTLQDIKIDSIHILKTRVNRINDIGIIRAKFFWSGAYNEDRFSDTTSVVDTWINRNGVWQVVSRVMTN